MKKYFWNILIFAVFLFLVFFVLKDIKFKEMYFYLTFLNPLIFLLAIFVCFLSFLVWALRWKILFKSITRPRYFFLLKVLFAGAFFNTVTPGAGIGGEPFRAYFLSKRYKISKNKMLSVVLADKFFHLLTLSFFSALSILFFLFYVDISGSLRLVLETILLIMFFVIALTIFLTLKKLDFNLGAFFKKAHFFKFIKKHFKSADDLENYINKKIRELSGTFRKVVKNKKNIFFGLSLSGLYVLLEGSVSYLLFLAFGIDINFISVIIVVSLGILIGTGSFLPGGIGVIETSMIVLYSAIGVNLSLALLIALFSRMIYYFFSLFIGGLCLISLKKDSDKK